MNKKHVVRKVLGQTRYVVYLLLILSMLAMPVAPAFAQAPANGSPPPPAPTPAQTQLATHKCGGPGNVKNSPFFGIQVKTHEEVQGTKRATLLSEALKEKDVRNVLIAHPLQLQNDKAMVVSSSLDTLHAWLALGVPVPALMRMDTSDTMLTMVIPGANDKDFVVYYKMAEPVGHFRTMAEIYRTNEKTVDLVAASVNGKLPRFGGRANGRFLQGNGSTKASTRPDISCGGCFNFLNGPWSYSWTTCASFDMSCLRNCGLTCSSAAILCAACASSIREGAPDKKACGLCGTNAFGCATCGITGFCCARWSTGCVDCGAP